MKMLLDRKCVAVRGKSQGGKQRGLRTLTLEPASLGSVSAAVRKDKINSKRKKTHLTQSRPLSLQARAKKKSIKLLIAVVIVFALCWMPLNLYHLLTDFHPDAKTFNYSNVTFFICHWIAISSTCFNPFVYCWFNEHFRKEVKSRFRWCIRQSLKIHPGSENDNALLSLDCTHPPRRKKCPSMTSSGRTQSITRRETTLTPDQDDLQVLMICDKVRAPPSGGPGRSSAANGKEVRELIPKYENGRVEFHSI